MLIIRHILKYLVKKHSSNLSHLGAKKVKKEHKIMTKYIAVLDVGTTNVRCFIYDEKFIILSMASKEIENLSPQHGYHEIDPELLVETCTDVIKKAVLSANVPYSEIVLGISTLRA